jgi:thiamine-phosphate pyrophosphorylase
VLCLVTDRRRLTAGNGVEVFRRVIEQCRAAAVSGVDIIQVRELDLEARSLAELVSSVLEATRGSAARVVVNERLDVAIACGANGVHLRSDSIPAAAARSIAPPGFVIGRSVHRIDEAVDCAPAVDYLVAGTVYPTPSKPASGPFLGLAGLDAIARAVPVPVLGVGGMTLARIPELASSRAAGLAAIGMFLQPESIASVVSTVRRAFDTAPARSSHAAARP